MRRIFLRTLQEKQDAEWCRSRSDEEFFASGACHALAGVFLTMYPSSGFRAWRVCPEAPHRRGSHVVVARGDVVFDWLGYSNREDFLKGYVHAMRGLCTDWGCKLIELGLDPIGSTFCDTQHHRHPSQFPHDPTPRAQAFIRYFAHPDHLLAR